MPKSINYRLYLLAGAALLLSATPVSAQVVIPAQPIPVPTAADRLLLKDVIDLHAHLDPDSFGPNSAQAARRLDVFQMAQRARRLGMRGFVIKQHYDQTAQLAYVTRQQFPGIEAFGQLCLNLTVGGLNVAAIQHFAEVKGGFARIVAMPTWDSENNVRSSKTPDHAFVAVSRNGELLPETKAAIAAIAAARTRDTGASFALSTGHIAASEALLVIREARRQGIERIVVTHAAGPPVNMTLDQMREAVSMGAYIEFVGGFTIGEHAILTPQQVLEAVRALGADHIIVSSDGGQMNRPYPDDMMALFAGQLRKAGVTSAELHTMMADNPAKLLGIPVKAKR